MALQLRIWCCYCCGVCSVPGLGTSIATGVAKKKKEEMHLGCFQISAIMDKAAVNIVHRFLCENEFSFL